MIIVYILIVIGGVIELIRLLNFGNGGGLAAIISRPFLGLMETSMLIGLICWLFELFVFYYGVTHLVSYLF